MLSSICFYKPSNNSNSPYLSEDPLAYSEAASSQYSFSSFKSYLAFSKVTWKFSKDFLAVANYSLVSAINFVFLLIFSYKAFL